MGATNDPTTVTILAILGVNWYKKFNLYIGSYLDTHIITHFLVDRIADKKPTISPKLKLELRTKPSNLHILCAHHNNTHVGTLDQMTQSIESANNL